MCDCRQCSMCSKRSQRQCPMVAVRYGAVRHRTNAVQLQRPVSCHHHSHLPRSLCAAHREVFSDTGGGGEFWPSWYSGRPTHHIRKNEIFHKGRERRAISGTQTFLWPQTHPPPV